MSYTNILVPVFAGLLGGIIGIYLGGRITKDVKIILAFSGSYLFGLTILHLFPEIFHEHDSSAAYYVLLGFLTQFVLDFFSKGVEHGHVHKKDLDSKVFPTGIFIALCIHSFIEGLPLSEGAESIHIGHNHMNTNGLILGIAIHKIPEAIALAALIFHFYSSTKKTLLIIALYCLATPAGVIAGTALMNSNLDDTHSIYVSMLAFAIGIFIHVSTTIIFEADEHHKLNWKKVFAILAGLGLVILT